MQSQLMLGFCAPALFGIQLLMLPSVDANHGLNTSCSIRIFGLVYKWYIGLFSFCFLFLFWFLFVFLHVYCRFCSSFAHGNNSRLALHSLRHDRFDRKTNGFLIALQCHYLGTGEQHCPANETTRETRLEECATFRHLGVSIVINAVKVHSCISRALSVFLSASLSVSPPVCLSLPLCLYVSLSLCLCLVSQ